MSEKPKTVRINMVERPEWSVYDTAGELNDIVFQNTFELLTQFDKETLTELAEDVLSIGRKKRLYATGEEEDALWAAWKSHDREIETFSMMVQDAASRAWESAFTPTDRDIDYAVEQAIDYFADTWKDWVSETDILLSIFGDQKKRGEPRNFMRELLKEWVSYERKEGWYDRYLVFDPEASKLVEQVIEDPGSFRGEWGVLDWRPFESMEEEAKKEILSFFGSIKEPFISQTFGMLDKEMKDIDYWNRVKFDKEWKGILSEDPRQGKVAKKELKTLLEGVEQNG